MIHGPCGDNYNPYCPCIDPDLNICSKGFPKPFQSETSISENSYPEYRRLSLEDGGFQHIVKYRNSGIKYIVDNQWIVQV